MALNITCSNPQCRKVLTVPDDLAGQDAVCLSCGAHTAVPGTPEGAFTPGVKLGHYRIVRKIDEGRMGAVYEAVQEGLNRRVAVKVSPSWLAADPAYMKRFRQEAQTAAALDHRNIVRIYEIGEERGRTIFTTEFVEGESLRRWIQQEKKATPEEAWDVLLQAARGLSHAWDHQVVHRDIKPEHLMLTRDGVLKIAYLSVHKVTAGAANVVDSEVASAMPYYMSPEQVKDSLDVDIRSDIYSLGATVYHIVTGQIPFEAPTAVELAMKVVREPLRPVRDLRPGVPGPLAAVIEKMMAKEPEDRYQTPTELLAALDKANPAQAKEKLAKAQELVKLMTTLEMAQQVAAEAATPASPQKPSLPAAPASRPPTRGMPAVQPPAASGQAAASRPPTRGMPAVQPPAASGQAAASRPPTRGMPAVQPHPPASASQPAENFRPNAAVSPPARQGLLFAVLGIAAVAVIAVAAFWVTRSLFKRQDAAQSPGATETTVRPVEPGDSQREAIAGMFDYTMQYVEEHPEDYREIVNRFETLKERGRNTEFEFKAEDQARVWRARWDAAAQKEFERRQKEAEAQLQAERFDEVSRLWKEFPDSFRTDAIAGRINLETRKLSDRAATAAGQLGASARPILAKQPGSLSEAEVNILIDVRNGAASLSGRDGVPLNSLSAWLGAEQKTFLQGLTDNLEALLEAHKSVKAAEQAKAYNSFWGQLSQLVKGKKFKEAEDLIAASQAILEGESLTRLQQDIQTLKSLWPRLEANLGTLKNKSVLVGGISMKVTDIREGKFIVRQNDGEVALGPEILDAEQQADLACASEKDPKASTFQRALFLFFYGNAGQASKALEEARASGLDLSLYESRVLPILVVTSVPSAATVDLSPKMDPSKLPGKGSKPLTTPVRIEVQRNTTYTVEVTKEGYFAFTRKIKVGQLGEHRVEATLQKFKLPASIQEDFDIPSKGEDSRGNPVRRGEDPDFGYPFEIRHRASGIHLVFVPSGGFPMGSPEGEKGRDADETQHTVTFSQPFYIGKYEVTAGEFKRFVQRTGYRTDAERGGGGWVWAGSEWVSKPDANWKNPYSQDPSDEHPVVLMSWNDAQKFVNGLNGGRGDRFRLPSEAQWEFACRAGSETRFSWGEDESAAGQYANVADRTAKQKFPEWPWAVFDTDDGFITTAPVGRFKPNALGLYDTLGNAWEWCSDWYESNYATNQKLDPQGPASGTTRVWRGGHWASQPAGDRAASRGDAAPDYRDMYSGFRVAFTLAGK
ncbi:MAG: SUMF1/EgtB/PvdO family nonheme iron enzyme [Planctomycetes bacterium]|nr:SUMF1/EgtB/PvdO family nonheme iron enzyme [Planctomycetota bacterium]